MKAPDPRWPFGFAVLIIIATLIAIIGLGDVKEENSAGIKELIGALIFAFGLFCQWAFSRKDEPRP